MSNSDFADIFILQLDCELFTITRHYFIPADGKSFATNLLISDKNNIMVMGHTYADYFNKYNNETFIFSLIYGTILTN